MCVYIYMYIYTYTKYISGFPGGPVVKNLPADAGNTGSIPGKERVHMPQGH